MTTDINVDEKVKQELKNIATKLRIDAIEATEASKSGHPTSCSSIAEILSVLFFRIMRYEVCEPLNPANDRLILSKGHAAPILYAAWAEVGLFSVEELKNLRKIDSDLEGHPTPRLNFIDVATGSLGQGLSIANGMCYVGKYFDKASYRTYVILGDGETAEGSVWEAISFASHYKLDNLCAIFDINRLGQSEPTALGHNVEVYKNRLSSFGFHAIIVDGHCVQSLIKAFCEAESVKGKPTAIIAKTFKGNAFPGISDKENWHGKALGDKAAEVLESLRASMKDSCEFTLKPEKPREPFPPVLTHNPVKLSTPPAYEPDKKVATRLAYGNALAKIAHDNPLVIGLDGDTKNSTFSDKIKTVNPDRYIECFIAEQNLVGVGIGAGCRGRTIPFMSAFAAFFTRAFDQIRMGAVSQTNANFAGSHCGISIGSDGPSQMALEDIAMFRAVQGSTVFYPSDAVSMERAVELAANIKGICFIRSSRPEFNILYSGKEKFAIGKAKLVRSCGQDQVLLIGAGVTLHEAIKASEELECKHNINARVADLFTIKPIDKKFIVCNAKECGGLIVTIEDHYPEGGIGEAVLAAVSDCADITVKVMAVRDLPRSGPPDALLDKFGISSKSIVKQVCKMC